MEFQTCRRLQDALAYIRSGAPMSLSPGRHELFDGIYVNVFQYTTKTGGLYEAHRKYLDIHILLKGTETVRIADVQDLTEASAYSGESDCLTGKAEGKAYVLKEGEYMVIFPEEAHLPGLQDGGPAEVTKAVIKVPV